MLYWIRLRKNLKRLLLKGLPLSEKVRHFMLISSLELPRANLFKALRPGLRLASLPGDGGLITAKRQEGRMVLFRGVSIWIGQWVM